ncbi:MAG: DUF2063 domain-containing protein, partial [Pseudomonadota bacterium]
DVARLERAVLEAQHAADAVPLDVAGLVAADRTGWRIAAHPAARLVASAHPIVSIRAANGRTTIAAVAEHALVTRPADDVIVQPLDPAVGTFASLILGGESADIACKRARVLDPGFEEIVGWQPLLRGGALLVPFPETTETTP